MIKLPTICSFLLNMEASDKRIICTYKCNLCYGYTIDIYVDYVIKRFNDDIGNTSSNVVADTILAVDFTYIRTKEDGYDIGKCVDYDKYLAEKDKNFARYSI
ncbi:hypothetical protein PIROE2DRAFT_16426 [Piromyces sp. E2]|nr:hypothetical protein PIROE2DRAFT_16426 [Piromyces sp. E2]|eukprot:OUM58324.1 hypothetical protein PIROE2DRAFT_16426 [Piromyces sp. E2]